MDYLERHIDTQEWIICVKVFILIVFSVAKYYYPKQMSLFIRLPLTTLYLKEYARRKINQALPFLFLMTVSQTLILSLFLWHSFIVIYGSEVYTFLNICIFIAIFWILKISIIRVWFGFFRAKRYGKQIISEKLSFVNVASIFLYIYILLFINNFETQRSFILIASSVFLLIILRGLGSIIVNTSKVFFVKKYYYIVYLCAVEILPYVLILKKVL